MLFSRKSVVVVVCLLIGQCHLATSSDEQSDEHPDDMAGVSIVEFPEETAEEGGDDSTTELVDRLLAVLLERRDSEHSDTKTPTEEQKIAVADHLPTFLHEEDEGKDIELRASMASACRGRELRLTALTGSVSTPLYGTHRYPNSARCRWVIVAPGPAAKIVLRFKTPFSIEEGPKCAYDSLTVSEGGGAGARLVGRYCNTNPPPVTVRRTTSAVSLLFVSDLSVAGAGFTLDYTITPAPVEKQDACSGRKQARLQGTSGSIRSLNYPRNYDNNVLCRWEVKVPTGQRVRLDFKSFDVEGDVAGCGYDNLTVYDGDTDRARPIGKYCGRQVPEDITTSGNAAFLVFASDDSVTKKGFLISYHGVQVTTPGPGQVGGSTTASPRPHVDLSCTFEEGNMCLWTPGAGGGIEWKLRSARRNTYVISNGIRWGNKDHTLSTSSGHYVVIDGNQNVAVAHARGFLVSPLMSAGPAEGRCLTLWYNMYYTKGSLQVLMRREGQSDEVIWQRDGFQGNGWHKGRIALVSGAPFRVVLAGSRGSRKKETGIAMDDVRFEKEPCLAVQLDCGKRSSSSTSSTSSAKRDLLEALLGEDTPPGALADISERVLGGQPSSVGMWPWIVNIRTRPPGGDTYMACGGSLIARQWVLTAAHCFEYEGHWLTNPLNIELRLGEANVGNSAWEQSQINIRPAKVIIHPQRSKKKMGQVAPFDLALVKLPHKVVLSDEINVICLPPSGANFRSGTHCVVSGWGLTADGKGGSERLLHVNLDILSNRMCSRYFGSEIGSDLLCAKHSHQVKAACKGDSGGPLVCRAADHYVLAGVVSWGVPCTRHNRPLPSAFARVTYYLPWIESTLNSEQ